MALNETHDAGLQSWVASANTGKSDFPIQTLPFAVFRRKAGDEAFRGGVAIGDQVLDMAAVSAAKPIRPAAPFANFISALPPANRPNMPQYAKRRPVRGQAASSTWRRSARPAIRRVSKRQ